MPRVEKNAEVTLVVLVYRSLDWLYWCMKGVDGSVNSTRYRWLVVANDATDEVIGGLHGSDMEWLDHRNANPEEFYINRVYRAWNRGVAESPTHVCVLLNSDMWPHDRWLDELLAVKLADRRTVPTSLLIESGRLPSAMPEHVMDLGRTPDSFKPLDFHAQAQAIQQPGMTEAGRLYMPILLDRQEFHDVGGYPKGNPPGTTGDKDLIRRYGEYGMQHVTALGSVVYHCQEGEMRWP